MIHPSLQNKRVVGLNLEGVGCCEADGCQSGSVGSPRPTDRPTASQPAMHAWTNGQMDGATGERWNAHLLGGRKSRGERRGRKYELWQRWRHQEFKKNKKNGGLRREKWGTEKALGGLCTHYKALWWQISAQRMVISDSLFIQGLQTRPRTSLSLLGLKGAPTAQPNSSHSTWAPISSCLFPSTTQTRPEPVTPCSTTARGKKKKTSALPEMCVPAPYGLLHRNRWIWGRINGRWAEVQIKSEQTAAVTR